ncbi:helix-turn-helix domain-containing protein [Acidithiobacillus sp. HP-11]|uniref:helix-turn-helix domain-containing protein n=1 Tax=Acidithiobacillus sp. HP-11 TaxID=2697656 RepID=UPI00187A5BE8|nr:helix-turn-helix domain-containing protein [Acidithiobacillus sp. HP-11]MBE7567255.1 helix-turn-helix domain-containing protein [Acidithiobacillus sp. HP-11]
MTTAKKTLAPGALPTDPELRVIIRQRLGVPPETPGHFREGFYYSPKDVCDRLGISQSTLLVWRKRYAIPHLRIGRTTRYAGGVLNALADAMEKVTC